MAHSRSTRKQSGMARPRKATSQRVMISNQSQNGLNAMKTRSGLRNGLGRSRGRNRKKRGAQMRRLSVLFMPLLLLSFSAVAHATTQSVEKNGLVLWLKADDGLAKDGSR